MARDTIRIVGARQHNLRNLTLEIPKNRLVVLTGTSGSGKSSLAFDTLYAEGQRRYVESLSAYARQFLDRLEKPDVDLIDGLSPAIAIEQRTSAPNPRSTVATATEIYDYLRVLYAAAGQPHDPATGQPVFRTTAPDIVESALALPERTRLMLLAPVVRGEPGDHRHLLEKLRRRGFVRARVDGTIVELEEKITLAKAKPHTIEAVVDRLVVKPDIESRLTDSLHTALRLSGEDVLFLAADPAEPDAWREIPFTTAFASAETGFRMPDVTPRLFSFNSRDGACPECHGLGAIMVGDPDLIVPDPDRSLNDGAVKSWWSRSPKLAAMQQRRIAALAKRLKADPDAPFRALPKKFRDALFFGDGATAEAGKPFEGIVREAERLHAESESESTRRSVRRFLAARTCPACGGARLRPEALAVTITADDGRQLGIAQFCLLSVTDALAAIRSLALTDRQRDVCRDVASEIEKRLSFLERVGLEYLDLSRESATLSGGEAQRIRLATQIGGGLSGVLYVLDEPSIGLHQRDNQRLLATLRDLRDLGNSVVVVEHDAETILAADHVVDLGPGAGPRGGEILAQGKPADIMSSPRSLTGRYLSGELRIQPAARRFEPPPYDAARQRKSDAAGDATGWLAIHGAAENNLKNIDVPIPVGAFTCVTGVSGSGKSTLVDTILRRALFRRFFRSRDQPGRHDAITGLLHFEKAVVIDQTPIGRSPRSNPVTYVGAFAPIRSLFSQLPASRVRGYGPSHFSFNVQGGRCETCRGDGALRIDMHFLTDVFITCEACEGKRYSPETLEITYKGKNIAEVLAMDIEEAVRFFARVPAVSERLEMLFAVGLGYLKLGQAATTLSGGEAQRVKLAAELARKSHGSTLYLLDEPTTGLHFADIQTLLDVLFRLRDAGHTLVVIEHNLDVIRCADWVIDLGPDSGPAGGNVVAAGAPENIAAAPSSATGRCLRSRPMQPSDVLSAGIP